MYVIRNKKRDIFYKLDVCKGVYHFVINECEAKKFSKKKGEARINKFKDPSNFELVEIKNKSVKRGVKNDAN